MAKLNVTPTKSNLLSLKRQLAFAEEGYDLLEQKRQILIFELMNRLERTRAAEDASAQGLGEAFAALREAALEVGSEALEAAALGVKLEHRVSITYQHLMGLKLPRVKAQTEPPGVQFGLGGTSAHTDATLRRFVAVLPGLAELAELQQAVIRLARELRKTQRRCNALSKIFIPNYRETIAYITGTLEEREREAFILLKKVRNRLAEQRADTSSSS